MTSREIDHVGVSKQEIISNQNCTIAETPPYHSLKLGHTVFALQITAKMVRWRIGRSVSQLPTLIVI